MKDHSNCLGQSRGNQLVAKFSRLYVEATSEDHFALPVWMRDILLGRKVGNANMVHARRSKKRMIKACKRRILEFPFGHGRP
jgi:hypothetical protein